MGQPTKTARFCAIATKTSFRQNIPKLNQKPETEKLKKLLFVKQFLNLLAYNYSCCSIHYSDFPLWRFRMNVLIIRFNLLIWFVSQILCHSVETSRNLRHSANSKSSNVRKSTTTYGSMAADEIVTLFKQFKSKFDRVVS